MNRLPLRPVTPDQRAAYDRDGVVHLTGLFDGDWVARLRDAIDRDMAQPSAMATDFNAPAPAIAARLMGASHAHLFYDQLFVKEPGTAQPTPWHQDHPYWAVRGRQICTVWIALDAIPRAAGAVEYVAGSHAWQRWFRP